MAREDHACLAQPGGAGCGTPAGWLIIAPDRTLCDAQVRSLAHFGVIAQPGDPSVPPLPTTPVVCDGRSRARLRSLLDAAPARNAPLLVFGVNAAQERARLILAGADDAVSARIAPSELAARMVAAQRSRTAAQGIIRLAGFAFDIGLRQVCWQGEILPLMPREFDVLLVLARHAGLPVSRERLLQLVWRTAFDPGTNSPEVHIFKLRQRLPALRGGVRIETVKRRGYRLVSDGPAQRHSAA